jgi:hypothetical protein
MHEAQQMPHEEGLTGWKQVRLFSNTRGDSVVCCPAGCSLPFQVFPALRETQSPCQMQQPPNIPNHDPACLSNPPDAQQRILPHMLSSHPILACLLVDYVML